MNFSLKPNGLLHHFEVSYLQLKWPSGKCVRLGSCRLGLIPSGVKPMTLKLVFTASQLDAQHLRDSVKNKPASLFVVPYGKALGVVDRWLATLKRAHIAF